MELDWSALQQEAKSAGVLPDGDYNLVVVDATATTASTGKPMIKMKLRVLDGPQRDKPLWTQQVLSPDSPLALRIFFQTMAAFGLDSNFFAQLRSGAESMEVVARNLRNRAVTATVGTRPWQGQDRNEISGFRALESSGPVPPGVVTGAPTVGAVPGSPVGGPPVPAAANPGPAGPSAPPVSTVTPAPAAPSTPPTQPF